MQKAVTDHYHRDGSNGLYDWTGFSRQAMRLMHSRLESQHPVSIAALSVADLWEDDDPAATLAAGADRLAASMPEAILCHFGGNVILLALPSSESAAVARLEDAVAVVSDTDGAADHVVTFTAGVAESRAPLESLAGTCMSAMDALRHACLIGRGTVASAADHRIEQLLHLSEPPVTEAGLDFWQHSRFADDGLFRGGE